MSIGTADQRLAYWMQSACLLLGIVAGSGAVAHDMALDARWTDDGVLEGQLTYSDASAAQGNYIRVAVRGDSRFTPMALQTSGAGTFRVPLQAGYAYTISADGDEGHQMSIVVGAYSPVSTASAAGVGPPIYLVLAALLLLSLPLAWRLKRRENVSS